MSCQYTPEDLLLYLYKETSPKQTAEIEEALQNDWTLMEKCKVLKAGMNGLDKAFSSPRTEAILHIMRYAASTTPSVFQ
ncbi:MAG: hypothetical protein KGP35_04655 [Bacteroidetes bacterium]|nr:hypothetical protein [Bacteroidota bacterium]